jgi:hypothetical protein
MFEGHSPQEMLAASVQAFRKDETSRIEIEHGPHKYPGFDITMRSALERGDLFTHKLVVMVWPRIYTVSVSSVKEELIRSPEADAFLNSRAIVE